MSKKVLAPLLLMPFVLLAPVYLTGKALFWGLPATQFVPWWAWAYETLLSGHLPLWNPYLGMGAPLIANYQSALFYPPYWLYLMAYALGGVSALAWMQALIVALHIALGSAGMAALIRRLGLGDLAQAVGGLAFGMSGYIAARGWFASINAAVVWLPWILLFAYDAAAPLKRKERSPFSGPQVAAILKLALVIALQLLAGHAQLSWYTLLLAAAWMAFWAWMGSRRAGISSAASADTTPARHASPLTAVLLSWLQLALAGLLAAAIAAVQLLPTAEYLLQSQRSGEVNYEIAMTYSFWPWRFLDFVAPGLFGSPVSGDFWGYATYWEDAVHIGLLPFLLAMGVLIGAIFRNWRKKSLGMMPDAAVRSRGFAFFLLAVILVAFTLALGKNTPVFPWLYWHIPTFDMFKSPTRYSIWAIFALTLLAARGVDTWQRPTGRGLYWTRLATMGAFAVTLGAGLGWYALRNLPDFHISFVRALTLAGVFGLGVGALALLAPQPGSSPRWVRAWGQAVTLFVAADLLVTGWGLNPGIALDFYAAPPDANEFRIAISEKPGELLARDGQPAGRVYLSISDEDALRYDRYFIFETFDPGPDWRGLRAAMLPNLNLLERVPYVNNYDPMVPGRYARWMEWLDEQDAPPPEILDLMGVSVIEKGEPDSALGVIFTPRGDASASRVRWLPCARPAESPESAWELATSGTVDFEDAVILENISPPQISDCAPFTGTVSLQDTENPNRVLIQTESEHPGWVLLADVWYPGWQARVDGQQAQVLRANYLFRAVDVPAGKHVVTFVYRPLSFWLGAGVSLLTLLGLAVVARWSRTHKAAV